MVAAAKVSGMDILMLTQARCITIGWEQRQGICFNLHATIICALKAPPQCCTHHGAAVGIGVEVAAKGNNYPSIQHTSGTGLGQSENTQTHTCTLLYSYGCA